MYVSSPVSKLVDVGMAQVLPKSSRKGQKLRIFGNQDANRCIIAITFTAFSTSHVPPLHILDAPRGATNI